MAVPLTVVIPVSPIASHPETSIIEETVASIRHHLPDAELLLTFDGVRPEQEARRADYEEAIRRTLWLAKGWGAVCPFVWDQHLHQVGMMRAVIDEIRTPLLLFVEQDTPLYTSETIDWSACIDFILSGKGNSIRFAHESHIPAEHAYLMHGLVDGMFMRTSQYSARPHLASVAYYRHLLDNYFTPEANCFLEDPLHSVCSEAAKLRGEEGLREHGLFIYHPEGSILRSRHSDGRAGEDKFDAIQRF